MGYTYQQRHNEQMDGYGRSVYKSPYSLFLTGTGGIIACLITFGLFIENRIFFKELLKRCSVINNQLLRSGQPVLATVSSTDALYSSSQSDEVPSHSSAMYTNDPVSSDVNIRISQECKSDNNYYLYAWPTTKSKHCSKPVPESSTLDVRTEDAADDPDYRNVVLANGQHVTMNNVYNI